MLFNRLVRKSESGDLIWFRGIGVESKLELLFKGLLSEVL